MGNNKVLKLRNDLINSLIEWLSHQALPGKMSRARSRFIKLLQPRAQEMDKVRRELLAKYSHKDKDGKAITKEPTKEEKEAGTTARKFDLKDREGFVKEYGEYLEETFIIDVTPANEDDIQEIKGIILNSTQDFKDEVKTIPDGRGGFVPMPMPLATNYDKWCIEFERIEDSDKEKEKKDDKDDQDNKGDKEEKKKKKEKEKEKE